MAAKIRAQLTYANVMSSLAVFLVLAGGTALALSKNSVRSKHIKNGQVRSVDIQNSGVKGVDVLDNSLTGADIDESSLGQAPSAQNAVNAQHAQSADSASLATELQFFGQPIWNNSTTDDVPQLTAGSCFEQPVAADPAVPSDTVVGTVSGGNAPNPLPNGMTADFLIETGNVILRVCNVSNSTVNGFTLSWQFVVLRRILSP
jgi:hypothetical protein